MFVAGLDERSRRVGETMGEQRQTIGRVLGGIGAGFGGAIATLGGVAGSWLAYSAAAIDHRVELPLALAAERHIFASEAAGMLSYYGEHEGQGPPLVLIHSINAAASAYEMRPLFAAYRGRRPVYALDLPGFGFSERGDRTYSPALYVAAITELLRTQVREAEPVDLVALSLGAEFAARVALETPDLVRSLTLISPSGLRADGGALGVSQRAARDRRGDGFLRAFSFPLWSQGFYDLLTTAASIKYYLRKSFVGAPDPGLVAYGYATSHQPDARYAPLHFISGKLFTPDIRATVYERLAQPTLVLYDRDGFVSFDALPTLVQRRPNWRAERIAPTLGLPQFEETARTVAALDRFWATVDAGA
jgi:pimeloyl-ACP methyl ester carboxylesterase